MANFDSSKWYELFVASRNQTQAMSGTALFTQESQQTRGAVLFQDTNNTFISQRWQIYRIANISTYIDLSTTKTSRNQPFYVLRTEASGPNGYLSVALSRNATALGIPGNTVPIMRYFSQNYSSPLAGDDEQQFRDRKSVFWQILPWQDGTFYLTNAQNGSDWHLHVRPNSNLAMNSDFSSDQQARQAFTFQEWPDDQVVGADFNQVSLSNLTTPAPSDSDSSSSSSSVSKTTIIALSTVLPIVFLILAALTFFFLRRRRQKRTNSQHVPTLLPPDSPGSQKEMTPHPQAADQDNYQHPYHDQETQRPAELQSQSHGQFVHELDTMDSHTHRHAELPGSMGRS